MASAWIQHVQKTYQAGKAKGMSYKQAMQAAKKTWAKKKSGSAVPVKKGKKSKALITTKPHSDWFKVRHFAGTVQYESGNFLEKNKDTLNQDIVDLLAESSDPLVKLLFAPKVEDSAAETTADKENTKLTE